MTNADLLAAAVRVRENALAPYSGYRVGAALLSGDGRVFTGCNVESSSYGLTMCAERVALFKAVSEGARAFVSIALSAGPKRVCRPCGACRQLLWELAPDVVVIADNGDGRLEERKLGDLLPDPFDQRYLKEH